MKDPQTRNASALVCQSSFFTPVKEHSSVRATPHQLSCVLFSSFCVKWFKSLAIWFVIGHRILKKKIIDENVWVMPIHILAALMQMNNVNAWESPTQVVKVKEYWMEIFDWWYDGVVRERWKRKFMSFAIWFCQNPPTPPGIFSVEFLTVLLPLQMNIAIFHKRNWFFLLQINRTFCACKMLQTKQAPQQKKVIGINYLQNKWSGTKKCEGSDPQKEFATGMNKKPKSLQWILRIFETIC